MYALYTQLYTHICMHVYCCIVYMLYFISNCHLVYTFLYIFFLNIFMYNMFFVCISYTPKGVARTAYIPFPVQVQESQYVGYK